MRAAKRLLALILSLFVSMLSTLSFMGCAYEPIEPDDEDLTVVGQVEGKDVYLEELRFVAYTYRDILTAQYGEDIFEGDEADKYLDMLRELVYSNITANYAILLLCEEVSIELGNATVLEKVNETIAESVEEMGGMGKYKKFLKENHMTDHFYRFSTEISLLENELMYVYVDDLLLIEDDDEEIYDIIKDDFIVVRHIFVSHTTEGASDRIETANQRLSAGEAFGDVMADVGEDTDMTEEGLFILEGYMTQAYEDVAFGLKVGERSDIVSDENGYYIIERLEMSVPSLMMQFDYLKELYQTYTFYSMIDEAQAKLTFVPNEACESYMKDPFNS
ncbi:MAG: peptidylprolyl isomerase [Clostridia bacterium]|nr:peptidylprolyl isomerase [Clostridia bacterium]